MTSFARLLLMPRDEWEKTQRKGKPPKGKPDAATLSLATKVLRARLAEYPTTLQVWTPFLLSRPEVNVASVNC